VCTYRSPYLVLFIAPATLGQRTHDGLIPRAHGRHSQLPGGIFTTP